MDERLSTESQRYLTSVVSAGLYPSEQAALEAAIAALRERNEQSTPVPIEHLEAVEKGIASSIAGRSRPLTAADWARFRQIAREACSDHPATDA